MANRTCRNNGSNWKHDKEGVALFEFSLDYNGGNVAICNLRHVLKISVVMGN